MRQRAESWSAPHNKRKLIHFSLPTGRAKSNGFCFKNQSGSWKFKSHWKVSGLVISEWQLECKCTREKDDVNCYLQEYHYSFYRTSWDKDDIDVKEMARKCFILELLPIKCRLAKTLCLWITEFGWRVFFRGLIYWYRSNCYAVIVVNPAKRLIIIFNHYGQWVLK